MCSLVESGLQLILGRNIALELKNVIHNNIKPYFGLVFVYIGPSNSNSLPSGVKRTLGPVLLGSWHANREARL